ncbi:uroporphyrinogen-III C-methyltransferase [Pseudoalteromonas sp. T1lg65]|uniref:uroporphyrinogen-III C-methyltransferase n=1 Tax=Pseudoalteromonas sp. T1lg65 TaxID=2077101 RepID=UPI003F7AC182
MNIALTRPAGKSESLAETLEQQHVGTVITPVLTLEPVTVSQAALDVVPEAEIAIFISADAVKYFKACGASLSKDCALFAVGAKTASTINTELNRKAIFAKQADSEGLLALPGLQQVEGKRLLLIKGKGGRGLIASTLKANGAIVDSLIVYQRNASEANADVWLDHWRSKQIDGIVITSNSAADAIFASDKPSLQQWLATRHFFVVSQRVAEHLNSQYNISQSNISVSEGADNRALQECIVDYINQQGSQMTDAKQTSQPEAKAQTTVEQPVIEPPVVYRDPKISKTAVLALLLAIGSGVGAGFVFMQQQQFIAQLALTNKATQSENQLLRTQLSDATSRIQTLDSKLEKALDTVKGQLEAQSQQVKHDLANALAKNQQQVSGAFASELLYLQRLAAFKVNAERDYQGAIAILQRIAEVLENEADVTVVQQAVAADIAALQALPKPQTEVIYLQLHGLLEQAPSLAIRQLQIPEPKAQTKEPLSSDMADWKANLQRSWQKLADDFIRIRRHDSAVIDPLLDETELQLIRTQLNSYLTQAQTALMDNQASIFFAAISSAHQLLTQHYELQNTAVKEALTTLQQLERNELLRSENIELQTPKALKGWLK